MPKYLGTFQSWWGSWCWDTVHCRRLGLTQPHHKTTFLTGRWGAMAILPATMATSQQRGKGFCCGIMGPRREVALLWARIRFVQSAYLRDAVSCHRYGAVFADRHGAECGNGSHLFRRSLMSSALSSQGRRLSRQGQTITQRYSLCRNEPETAKCNWAMTADTILGFKGETQKWNGH